MLITNRFLSIKTYSGHITALTNNEVFVFGSNTQGRHGKGAAKIARDKFGAIYGQSRGRQGDSYAICTKDLTKSVHPSVSREDIISQLVTLYEYAKESNMLFIIAYSGSGTNLNGYSPDDMAKMFVRAGLLSDGIPENIVFEYLFSHLIFKNILLPA